MKFDGEGRKAELTTAAWRLLITCVCAVVLTGSTPRPLWVTVVIAVTWAFSYFVIPWVALMGKEEWKEGRSGRIISVVVAVLFIIFLLWPHLQMLFSK